MKELNNNFSEINVEELSDINAGGIGKLIPYIGIGITVYDAVTGFTQGFLDGMAKPR